jgi:two-component system, sensor histidine kinase and response regulator
MTAVVAWFEAAVSSIPLPILEVWGRFGYLVGFFLAVCAFCGLTFRIGERWGFGRARQRWNTKAFLSVPLTCVLIIATGYIGSFIVLVPGAQTFESLKDLAVLLCIVLFGYPALFGMVPAYMLSDLIEGVPPSFVLNWAEGYFFLAAFVWMAHQLIGRNPDFRRLQTWSRYGVFVALIMSFDPVMWGFICSEKFTSAISYRNITSAVAFTLSVTWVLAPMAFLVALPLARRFGWFWAEIPGHVRERAIGSSDWIWESGRGEAPEKISPLQGRFPIRMFIFAPFIALVLVMVGTTAIVALQTADDDAKMLATRLHHAISANIRLQLDDYLARSPLSAGVQREDTLDSLLRSQAVGTDGRAVILDMTGKTVASSAPTGDPVVANAIAALAQHAGPSGLSAGTTEFHFDHITAKPLSRETWLTYATAYRDHNAGRDWILMTAMPEAFYLASLRKANSRSAMMLALALVLSLVLGAALASMVTAPLRHMAYATQTMAGGDLSVRVPGTNLEELDALGRSFNAMAAELKKSFDDLVEEVATRKMREHELKESEARLRLSEERLKLAIDAVSLGIWDWDVEQDRLVWDESMYRLYGVRKEEFSGAFDAWSRCLVPEDVTRAKEDVDAALRGDREFRSDFKVRRADGTIRIIRGVAQIIRNADGGPVRMVGINRDVTDLIDAERERVRANEAVHAAQAELAQVARLTTMGELAASIAHEVSQPLAAVVNFANGALRWLAQTPPNLEQTKSALKGVVEAGNHAREVFVRIRHLIKHRKSEYATLDVNEAIRDVLALTGSALRSRSVAVQTMLLADLPLALGDRVQLQQVIMNLVMNGADAMSSVTDRPRVLRVESKVNDEGSIEVMIGDSGTGIEEAIRHRIFDPLFTTKPAGMGMGLSICRRIIEAHGGRLWASPGAPHGAELQFTIPDSKRPSTPA